MNKKKTKILIVTLFFIIPISGLNAATIFFDPQETTVGPDSPFKVGITIDSAKTINAISVLIDIPIQFEVVDISDGNSVINFWVERPHLNNNHQLAFSGIIPGGFSGIQAKLLTLTLKASKLGRFDLGLDQSSRAYLNTVAYSEEKLMAKDLSLSVVTGRDNIINDIPDTDAPEGFEPQISRLAGASSTEDRWFVVFQAQDKGSGIRKYQIAESYWNVKGEASSSRLDFKDAESPYPLNDQALTSFIYVRAIDNIGNDRIEIVAPLNPKSWHEWMSWYIIVGVIVVNVVWLLFSRRKS